MSDNATPLAKVEEDEVNLIVIDPPLVIAYGVIGSIGMAGNLFVLITMVRFRHLRETVTDTFIINQSLIDFVASFFIVTTSFVRDESAVPRGLAHEIFCRLWLTNFPIWAMFVSSTYNLLMVTLERYIAIVHPLKFTWRIHHRRAYLLMTVVWIVGPAYNAAYMIPSSYINSEGNCSVYSSWPSAFIHSAHGILTVVVQFFVPLISITAFNYRIIAALREQVRRNSGSGDSAALRRNRIARAHSNMVKTLVLIFVCFVMCWVWNQGYYLLFNLGYPEIRLTGWFYHFSVIAVFSNCCFNPLIYALKYRKFQRAAKVLFACCWEPKRHPSEPTISHIFCNNKPDDSQPVMTKFHQI